MKVFNIIGNPEKVTNEFENWINNLDNAKIIWESLNVSYNGKDLLLMICYKETDSK